MSIVCRTYLVLLEGVHKGMEVRGVEQSRVDEQGLHGITGRWVVTLSVYYCVRVCGRQSDIFILPSSLLTTAGADLSWLPC